MLICEMEKCTGCGMCTAICPKHCIQLEQNKYGSLKYKIDNEKCINCKKCEKMCPQNLPSYGNFDQICYAGWATDPCERATSASGGIASVLYRRVMECGGAVVGACYENGEFCLKLTEDKDDIEQFKGSRYVKCSSEDIFEKVKEKISSLKHVLFIGTPCQVAGIKSYIGESDLLLTVDLVCHGTPPQAYFEEHFKAHLKNITAVNFRDKGMYHLKMENNKGTVYEISAGTDEYYLSFINGVIFDDCCYQCRYANLERVSDITIGDFRGIDAEVGRSEAVDRVSLVLCNTQKGQEFINNTPGIRLIERELAEALPKNQQLVRPFEESADRIKFKKLFPKYGFDKTIHKLGIEKIRRKNKILTILSNMKKKIKSK